MLLNITKMKYKFLLTAVIANISLTCISQTLDQNHTGLEQTAYSADESSLVAQSFTAGLSGSLCNIYVDVSAQYCPFNADLDTIAFVAKIYEGDGLTGALLSSQNLIMNLPYSRNYYPIVFNPPAEITSGNKYTLELSVIAGQICDVGFNIPINFVWYNSGGDTYSGGRGYAPGLYGNPSDDLYFQTYVTETAGTENISGNLITTYPNPAQDIIFIESNKIIENNIAIQIIDKLGEVLVNKIFNNTNLCKIDISNLQGGIYIIKTESDRIMNTFILIKL